MAVFAVMSFTRQVAATYQPMVEWLWYRVIRNRV